MVAFAISPPGQMPKQKNAKPIIGKENTKEKEKVLKKRKLNLIPKSANPKITIHAPSKPIELKDYTMQCRKKNESISQ